MDTCVEALAGLGLSVTAAIMHCKRYEEYITKRRNLNNYGRRIFVE